MRALLLFVALLGVGLAQSTDAPGTVADAAIESWLTSDRPALGDLATLSTEEACRLLPDLLQNPPPPAGTHVNLAERREVGSEEGIRSFSYPATLPSGTLEVAEVSLEQDSETGSWQVARVGFQSTNRLTGTRAWLQTPVAAGLFTAFSLYVLYLLFTPSFLRGWLAEGRQVIAEHRRLVVGTLVAYYLIFFLGGVTGANLPEACAEGVLEIVNSAIESVGAADAYGSLNVARAAAVTFYQNFGVVTLSVLFGFGVLFGVPAYLFGALSFYAQAIPFGLVGSFGLGQLFFVLILLFLELTSYFLVIAGGGMLLVTVVRQGFRGFGQGFRKLALTLPFALLLLLVGAWYEAAIIILPQLLGGP